jgi:predicted PurR-regulated permease PerM
LVTLVLLGITGLCWLVFLLWPQLRPIAILCLVALLFSLLVGPIVRLLQRALPRSVAVLTAFMVFLIFLFSLLFLLIPLLRTELRVLDQNLPRLLGSLQVGLGDLQRSLQAWGINLSVDQLAPQIVGALERTLLAMLSFGLGFGANLLRILLEGFLTLLLAFYLSRDGPRLEAWFFRRLQRRWPWVTPTFLTAILAVLGRYFRAVVLVSLLGGLTIALGCWALGVPYPWLLGLAAFFGNFIPYVGPIITLVLGLALCLGHPWNTTLTFLAVFTGVSLLVNYLYSPLVLSKQMSIHPLLVMVAVLTGIALFGFWGAILAVPVVSMLQAAREKRGQISF